MGQETEAPALTPWNAPNALDTVVAGQKDLGKQEIEPWFPRFLLYHVSTKQAHVI
jgi:hypothetical protein